MRTIPTPDAATYPAAGEASEVEAAAARLLGRPPTNAELAEGAEQDALRTLLLQARECAGQSQSEVARRMGVRQSEVSRLETSIGPGTRLGRLRAYLAACDATLTLTLRMADGSAQNWGDAPPRPTAPTAAMANDTITVGSSPAMPQMLDDILALEASLAAVGLDPVTAARVRYDFLHRIRATAAQGQSSGIPGSAVSKVALDPFASSGNVHVGGFAPVPYPVQGYALTGQHAVMGIGPITESGTDPTPAGIIQIGDVRYRLFEEAVPARQPPERG